MLIKAGLRYEVLAETNPYRRPAPETMTVRVLADGYQLPAPELQFSAVIIRVMSTGKTISPMPKDG